MMAILQNSSECLAEIKKTKSAVRQQKDAGTKNDQSKKWKAADEQLNFIKQNQSKIESILNGSRDTCPQDIGKCNS